MGLQQRHEMSQSSRFALGRRCVVIELQQRQETSLSPHFALGRRCAVMGLQQRQETSQSPRFALGRRCAVMGAAGTHHSTPPTQCEVPQALRRLTSAINTIKQSNNL